MMKRRGTLSLVLTTIVVGILSYIIAGFIFKMPTKNAKAPVIQSVNQSFPDVASDPTYTSIFNDKALDPTQTVQIGNSNNNQPFVGH